MVCVCAHVHVFVCVCDFPTEMQSPAMKATIQTCMHICTSMSGVHMYVAYCLYCPPLKLILVLGVCSHVSCASIPSSMLHGLYMRCVQSIQCLFAYVHGMLCRSQTHPVGHSEACGPNYCSKVVGIGAGLGSEMVSHEHYQMQ